jgi:hypothetical protein
MWHDEPREILLVKQKLGFWLVVAASSCLVAALITKALGGTILWVLPAVTFAPILVRLCLSPESAAESWIHALDMDIENDDTVRVRVFIAQLDCQTGEDVAVLWLEEGRLRIEGTHLSLSLTNNPRPKKIEVVPGEVTLCYELPGRELAIHFRALEPIKRDLVTRHVDAWLESGDDAEVSNLPVEVQPAFIVDPNVRNRGWMFVSTSLLILAIITMFLVPKVVAWFIVPTVILLAIASYKHLVIDERKSVSRTFATQQQIASLNQTNHA